MLGLLNTNSAESLFSTKSISVPEINENIGKLEIFYKDTIIYYTRALIFVLMVVVVGQP